MSSVVEEAFAILGGVILIFGSLVVVTGNNTDTKLIGFAILVISIYVNNLYTYYRLKNTIKEMTK